MSLLIQKHRYQILLDRPMQRLLYHQLLKTSKRNGRVGGSNTKEDAEMFALKSIGDAFAMKAKQGSNAKKDADGLFGEMVAEELRQVTGRRKAMLKHKIQTTIFECQMEAWDEFQPKRQPTPNMTSPPLTPKYADARQFNTYESPIYRPPQQSYSEDDSSIGYYTNLVTKNK